jgi:hypothetical protein
MIVFPSIPPPPPAAGTDPRMMRAWYCEVQRSLATCVDALRNLSIPPRRFGLVEDGGVTQTVVPFFSLLRHGFTISGTSITLLSGKLKFHGGTSITTAQSVKTLAGTQFFYVHHVRGSTATSWQVAGAEPGVSSTDIDVFFYKFINGVLQVDGIGHLGDINLDLPLG